MKRNKRIYLFLFVLILVVGAFLRFYQLDKIPGSLEWDEVSIGYNAYSILQTGKDEYGEFLPTAFRAFGEYKQPVYIYLDVVPIALFGLTDFAVRFPAALFGSLSIVFVYFLTFELFYKYVHVRKLSMLAMLFFALSPWSIQFSRAAFEANVSLAFIISGVWLFLRGVRTKKQWCFVISMLLLVISTYTYISAKLFVPILLVCLFIYGWRLFKKQKVFAAILLASFIVLSMLWVFDTRSVARSQGVIFTSQQQQILETSLQQMDHDIRQHDLLGEVLHNRRIVYTQTLFENYLSHFNPIWLFFTGDEVRRHHAPNMGILYLSSLPFILLGIYFLLTKLFRSSWILFVWFLAAPIASALTFEAPHALRSLIFLPTWHIFEAAEIVFLLTLLRKKWLARFAVAIVATLYLISVTLYLHQYFIHTNTSFQKDWQYGYKEAMLSAAEHKRVIFAKEFEQPYIFYLYHTKYDPEKYLADGGSQRNVKKCYAIEQAYFGDCHERLQKGDHYIALEDAQIAEAKEIKSILFYNNKPAVKIFEY